jgi:hypothetical protein
MRAETFVSNNSDSDRGLSCPRKECLPVDRKELMSKIRADLRERPNSHFSEIYFRVTANRVSSTEVHNALYELLKRDEISTTAGKWRLIEERRKAS